MPHKDKEEHRKYALRYYHEHPEMKKKQLANERLNYWRKKYMFKFNCSLQDCKELTEEQLREDIKTEMSRI